MDGNLRKAALLDGIEKKTHVMLISPCYPNPIANQLSVFDPPFMRRTHCDFGNSDARCRASEFGDRGGHGSAL